jgi:hypothetical protein
LVQFAVLSHVAITLRPSRSGLYREVRQEGRKDRQENAIAASKLHPYPNFGDVVAMNFRVYSASPWHT